MVRRVPTIDTELGTERLCRGCGEFWPLDETFWYFQRGKVMGNCRACWADRSRAIVRARQVVA